MRHVRALLPAGLWLVSALSAANGLDDLRSALERLRSREPLRARVTYETTTMEKSDGKPTTTRSRASVVAEDGGAGRPVRLEFDGRLIDEVTTAEASEPAAALGELTGGFVARHLRAAEALLADLKGATLVSETTETLGGRTVRRLDLKLPRPAAEADAGVKTTRSDRIWIDGSGVPVEREATTHGEGSKFFIKVRADVTSRTVFGTSAGRLIPARIETDQKHHVTIGGDGEEHTLVLVEPL